MQPFPLAKMLYSPITSTDLTPMCLITVSLSVCLTPAIHCNLLYSTGSNAEKVEAMKESES